MRLEAFVFGIQGIDGTVSRSRFCTGCGMEWNVISNGLVVGWDGIGNFAKLKDAISHSLILIRVIVEMMGS